MQISTGSGPTSASALLAALDHLSDPETAGDIEAIAPELLARRIDGDDETVKVLTVHKAKGLEFAVVLCPTLWTAGGRGHAPWHADIDGARMIDTAQLLDDPTKAAAFMTVKNADSVETKAEARRVLYVALTRAKHRLVLWWAPGCATSKSPPALEHLLRHACGDVAQPVDLAALVARGQGTIAPPRSTSTSAVGIELRTPTPSRKQPTISTRTLDRRWRSGRSPP